MLTPVLRTQCIRQIPRTLISARTLTTAVSQTGTVSTVLLGGPTGPGRATFKPLDALRSASTKAMGDESGNTQPTAACSTAAKGSDAEEEYWVREQVPKPNHGFKSVQPLLQAFGRDMQKKIKVESWEELFNLNGSKLRTMDVTVKDRRYLLACLEKFRHGYRPGVFAREEKPKKKVRGWGPKIQTKKSATRST